MQLLVGYYKRSEKLTYNVTCFIFYHNWLILILKRKAIVICAVDEFEGKLWFLLNRGLTQCLDRFL